MLRVIVLAAALLLPACSGTRPSVPRDRVLVIGVPTDFDTLLSVVANAAMDRALLHNLVPPLLRPVFDCRVTYEPALAEGYRWVDAQTLEITLRDDLLWSDGRPLTSADVVETYRLLLDPAVASPFHAYAQQLAGPPEARDPVTVVFRWATPLDPDLALWHASQVPPVPAHRLEGADRATLRGHPLSSAAPLVAGPWTVDRWERGARLVLGSTDPEARGPARVVFRVLPESTTRILELEAGHLDVLEGLDVDDVDRLEAHPDLRVSSRGHRSLEWVIYNRRRPPFDDRRVREALSRAIDADALVAALLTTPSGRVLGRRASGTVSPELCGVQSPSPVAWDRERAVALLAEAGWRDSDADGILDKKGAKLQFILSTNAGNPRRAAAAVRIQAMLTLVGVQVELVALEPHAFFDSLRRRTFDAALTGRSALLVPDLAPLWRSGEAQPWNASGYADATTDRLIDESRAGRPGALTEALQRIADDHPATFLYWRDDLVAVNRRWTEVGVDIVSPWRELETWR